MKLLGSFLFLILVRALSAGSWVMLSPGNGYRVEWKSGTERQVVATPQVSRRGLSPLDRWFQVANGSQALAAWSNATGLCLLASDGKQLLMRRDATGPFRFSPDGRKLAFSTAKGIEIWSAGEQALKVLRLRVKPDSIRWTAPGLAVIAGPKLLLIDWQGKQRTLAAISPGAIFATGTNRIVYQTGHGLTSIDLVSGMSALLYQGGGVVDAEVTPDGKKVLFATTTHVYLAAGSEPVQVVTEAKEVRHLHFSIDGSAFLWASQSGGAVVSGGMKAEPMPPGARAAMFNKRRNGEVAITTAEGLWTWDRSSGTRTISGGISSNDGVNIAGDLLRDNGAVYLYIKLSAAMKANPPPISLDP